MVVFDFGRILLLFSLGSYGVYGIVSVFGGGVRFWGGF